MRTYLPPTVAAIALLLLIAGPLAAQPQELSVPSIPNPPGVGNAGGQCVCSASKELVLDQPPDQATAFFTDVAAGQSEAEGFVLDETTTITEIRVWGGYFGGNTSIDPDNFTVIFHDDAAGLPGANSAPAEALAAAACKEMTGISLLGVDEYVYRLDLVSPVTLDPGTYWLEIFNDTTGSPDAWAWESGVEDPAAGVASHAFASEVPGVTWFLSGSGVSFGAQLCALPEEPGIAIPTLGQLGLLVLILSLIGVGFRQLRRRRR